MSNIEYDDNLVDVVEVQRVTHLTLQVLNK